MNVVENVIVMLRTRSSAQNASSNRPQRIIAASLIEAQNVVRFLEGTSCYGMNGSFNILSDTRGAQCQG